MSFELDNTGNFRGQVRQAASSQLDKALKALHPHSNSARSTDISVHEARKRLKEVRALLRLVREGLGEKQFRRENKTLRDAARPLSEVRDATVLLGTLASLQKRYSGTINRNTFDSLQTALRRRRTLVRQRILLKDKALTKAAAAVKGVRDRAERWDLQRGAWRALQSGLLRAYKQGHKAIADSSREASDENLHEWRKRAKDLQYQLGLLERLCPEVMDGAVKQAKALTDLLGDDHDLAVLRGLLENDLKEAVPNEAAETLKGLIDARRTDLQNSAASLSEKLYAESPNQFVERLKTYWKAVA